MPSKSPAQHRLMQAAAHTPGGFGGVPQSVGKEFAAADKGSPKSREAHMQRLAKHGPQHAVGKSLGTSQSTVSRTLRRGFTQEGSAR